MNTTTAYGRTCSPNQTTVALAGELEVVAKCDHFWVTFGEASVLLLRVASVAFDCSNSVVDRCDLLAGMRSFADGLHISCALPKRACECEHHVARRHRCVAARPLGAGTLLMLLGDAPFLSCLPLLRRIRLRLDGLAALLRRHGCSENCKRIMPSSLRRDEAEFPARGGGRCNSMSSG